MSSLWPRNKPLNQPAHFGRIGAQPEPNRPDPVAQAAARAVNAAQIERQHKTLRLGGRAVVRS